MGPGERCQIYSEGYSAGACGCSPVWSPLKRHIAAPSRWATDGLVLLVNSGGYCWPGGMLSICTSRHHANRKPPQRAKSTPSFGCAQVPRSAMYRLPGTVTTSSRPFDLKVLDAAARYTLVSWDFQKLFNCFPKCFAALVMWR